MTTWTSRLVRCFGCGGMVADTRAKVIVRLRVSGDEAAERVQEMKLCDRCRRRVCTCGTCAAFDFVTGNEGWCRYHPPQARADNEALTERARVETTSWCVVGWRQAQVFEAEWVREKT